MLTKHDMMDPARSRKIASPSSRRGDADLISVDTEMCLCSWWFYKIKSRRDHTSLIDGKLINSAAEVGGKFLAILFAHSD